MTPIDFGSLVPCRTCRGTGRSRNPDWGDKDAARERARQRRHGNDIDEPTAVIACVECNGKGYLPPTTADQKRLERDSLRASVSKR